MRLASSSIEMQDRQQIILKTKENMISRNSQCARALEKSSRLHRRAPRTKQRNTVASKSQSTTVAKAVMKRTAGDSYHSVWKGFVGRRIASRERRNLERDIKVNLRQVVQSET